MWVKQDTPIDIATPNFNKKMKGELGGEIFCRLGGSEGRGGRVRQAERERQREIERNIKRERERETEN